MAKSVERFVLPSGLVIVVESHPVRAVSIGWWVKAGSALERGQEQGISHFLEHMLFKGTRNRSAYEIATSLEAVGGELNAFTDREVTCFHAYVLKEHFDLAIEVLSDLVHNPLFDEHQIDRERKVLLQEIASVEESPDELLSDYFFTKVWNHSPLGLPIQGEVKTLRNIGKKELSGFHQRFYLPCHMVLSIAGGVSPEKVKATIERMVEKKKKKTGRLPSVDSPKFHPGVYSLLKESQQVHFILGFEGIGHQDSRRFEALLTSQILGGGMSSRLFQELREKRGLAYSIDCDSYSTKKQGVFTIFGSVATSDMEECLFAIGKELKRLTEERISKFELFRVKEQIKGLILLSAESMESRQESIARQEIVFTEQMPISKVMKEIDGVTSERIYDYCKSTFIPQKEALAYLGESRFSKKALLSALWGKNGKD